MHEERCQKYLVIKMSDPIKLEYFDSSDKSYDIFFILMTS